MKTRVANSNLIGSYLGFLDLKRHLERQRNSTQVKLDKAWFTPHTPDNTHHKLSALAAVHIGKRSRVRYPRCDLIRR